MTLGAIARVNDSEAHSGFWPRVLIQLINDNKITEDDIRVAMGRVNNLTDAEWSAMESAHDLEGLND